MHSNMQIARLNEVMCTQKITLNHALNGHRLDTGKNVGPIRPHFKVRENLKAFKFDGYHWASNTVYKFQRCCFHGLNGRPVCCYLTENLEDKTGRVEHFGDGRGYSEALREATDSRITFLHRFDFYGFLHSV